MTTAFCYAWNDNFAWDNFSSSLRIEQNTATRNQFSMLWKKWTISYYFLFFNFIANNNHIVHRRYSLIIQSDQQFMSRFCSYYITLQVKSHHRQAFEINLLIFFLLLFPFKKNVFMRFHMICTAVWTFTICTLYIPFNDVDDNAMPFLRRILNWVIHLNEKKLECGEYEAREG